MVRELLNRSLFLALEKKTTSDCSSLTRLDSTGISQKKKKLKKASQSCCLLSQCYTKTVSTLFKDSALAFAYSSKAKPMVQ